MALTIKELIKILGTFDDQDMEVYFYQYSEKSFLGVQEEEISVEYVDRSESDGKIRFVPRKHCLNANKSLIFT